MHSGNNDDVHHLFFSRLWTVGRTVDGIVKTRRRYLRLGPGEEDGPLELALADSSHGLPMGEEGLRTSQARERETESDTPIFPW